MENVGRKSYGLLNETRGILSEVMLNGKSIERWNCTGFAFSDMERLTGLLDALDFVQQDHDMLNRMKQTSKKFKNEPIIFGGTFDVENGKANDTFIDTRGWGKVFLTLFFALFVACISNADFRFFSLLSFRIRDSLLSTVSIWVDIGH